MTIRFPLAAVLLCISAVTASGQERAVPTPRRITLQEALELASRNNHYVRLVQQAAEEKRRAKEVAKSAYFPIVRADSTFIHVTDTQFVGIPPGSLGAVGNNLIPPSLLVINQGALTTATFGTGVVQPLTQLLKVKAATDMAEAEVRATLGKARQVENSIALKVHEIYYKVLIAETRRNALQAKIQATEDLQRERVQQVKYGTALDADLLESRAQDRKSTRLNSS